MVRIRKGGLLHKIVARNQVFIAPLVKVCIFHDPSTEEAQTIKQGKPGKLTKAAKIIRSYTKDKRSEAPSPASSSCCSGTASAPAHASASHEATSEQPCLPLLQKHSRVLLDMS